MTARVEPFIGIRAGPPQPWGYFLTVLLEVLRWRTEMYCEAYRDALYYFDHKFASARRKMHLSLIFLVFPP